jgi:indolepyruvate ferredoxin oxidoreductase, alpha subunit
MKTIMSGNEAIARGAWEGGMEFASAYPGTPSTEILENIANYKDVYSEWAPNEKVGAEAAIGASIAGVRSLCAMKHVGLNVAADPLYTFCYTGVTGGMVFCVADDPGQHSSQNEQDNRNTAESARALMLEPSDSQECKDFMKLAFELSERFDTPIIMHLTTRVCHSKGLVELGERVSKPIVPYEPKIAKYVTVPANAKVLRAKLEDRIKIMKQYSETCDINKPEYNDKKVGVITSGISYQYSKEVFGEDASYLKLGMSWPFPDALVKEFAEKVDKIYVIEEMDPYIERHCKLLGIDVIGKQVIPSFDELNTDIVRNAIFGGTDKPRKINEDAVVRPPTLCAGCPHRGFFYALSKRKNIMINGDIGCYTLGAAPPLSALHTCICMGGSLSMAHGASIAMKRANTETKVVGVLGDSTFFHTGVESLIGAVYNQGSSVSIILDNRITGMTGHQQNPGSGYTLMGKETTEVDIPALCMAIGVKEENIYTVNPNHLDEVNKALDEALAKDEPTVLITKWPCALKKFTEEDKANFDLSPKKCIIDQDKCKKCKSCVGVGCPAIYNSGDKITINQDSCLGCGVCMQVCPFDAIEEVK